MNMENKKIMRIVDKNNKISRAELKKMAEKMFGDLVEIVNKLVK